MDIGLLFEVLKSGDYWLVAAVIFLGVILNLSKIVDFYHVNRKRRVAHLSQALSDPNLSENLKQHLKDELAIELFWIAHRVRLILPQCNAAILLKERIGCHVRFDHILRAVKVAADINCLEVPDARVEMRTLERASAFYNLIAVVVCLLFAGFSFIVFWLSLITAVSYEMLLLTVVCVSLSFLLFFDSISLFSVKWVNEALNNKETVAYSAG